MCQTNVKLAQSLFNFVLFFLSISFSPVSSYTVYSDVSDQYKTNTIFIQFYSIFS